MTLSETENTLSCQIQLTLQCICSSVHKQENREETQTMLWHAENGQVLMGDTQMSYVRFGYGEKAFIMLPGLSDGLTTVRGKALLLAAPYRRFFRDYTVYMFSRRDTLPKDYSIRDMAKDQAEALTLLGLKKVSVMGVSEGGMIAQVLAEEYPEIMDRLIIAVSAPCINNITFECVTRWIGFAKQGNHKQLMIDTMEKSYSDAYLKKARLLYPFLGTLGKPASYNRFLTNANAILSFDALEDLKKISCPVLIIAGEKDRIVGPEASREMHRQIPGSDLYIYENLGHAAYEEASDFNDRVFRFLQQ